MTTTTIEEIVATATGPVYQQIYFIGGRDAIADGLLLVAVILFWSIALDALAYAGRPSPGC